MAYELYWISGSPNAWRVMLTLEIKGISYISHRLDPGKQEHKSPAFLALNPRGKVPVLVDGNTVISESIAIMAYLEAKHPEPALFGATPQDTGHIWQRIFEVMIYARDAINNGVVRPIIRGQATIAGDEIKASALLVHDALGWVETLLQTTLYLAGGNITAADVVFMPIVQGLIRAGCSPDAKALQLGFDDFAQSYPAITIWLGRIEALPAYDKSYPPHWKNA